MKSEIGSALVRSFRVAPSRDLSSMRDDAERVNSDIVVSFLFLSLSLLSQLYCIFCFFSFFFLVFINGEARSAVRTSRAPAIALAVTR